MTNTVRMVRHRGRLLYVDPKHWREQNPFLKSRPALVLARMESVTERMKDRRGQRLLDNVGGASEDRTEPGRHNYRPQHMLLFSSLAQALTFFVFIWFWARQQYPST